MKISANIDQRRICNMNRKSTKKVKRLAFFYDWQIQHLFMIGSSQHELAKWLSEVLALVLKLYSSNCVKDSFTFANFIQNYNIDPTFSFLCSFDISSLFTNVPLDETIGICADALYRGQFDCLPFTEWNVVLTTRCINN